MANIDEGPFNKLTDLIKDADLDTLIAAQQD